MTRKRLDERREKETVIPGFDPAELARDLEARERPTLSPTATENLEGAPPVEEAKVYARILESRVSDTIDTRDTPRTMTAAQPAIDEETLGREMYGCYLASNFPEALVLAERVLERRPEHALAQLVVERCRTLLGSTPAMRVSPSSVLRSTKAAHDVGRLGLDPTSRFVLRHLDGVTDAETISQLLGVPRNETLDRLHALLELGVVELVSA